MSGQRRITLVWDSIHCDSKIEKQDLQAGDTWDRIIILQLARPRSKKRTVTEIWIDEDVFKRGSQLDWKKLEKF